MWKSRLKYLTPDRIYTKTLLDTSTGAFAAILKNVNAEHMGQIILIYIKFKGIAPPWPALET